MIRQIPYRRYGASAEPAGTCLTGQCAESGEIPAPTVKVRMEEN